MFYVLKKVVPQELIESLMTLTVGSDSSELVINPVVRTLGEWYIRRNSTYDSKVCIGVANAHPPLCEVIENAVRQVIEFDKIEYLGEYRIPFGFKLIRYDIGEGIDTHSDADGSFEGYRGASVEVEQYTVVIPLNDGYEGGQLYVCDRDVNVDVGDLAFFASCDPHGVTPVTSGTRFSLAIWFNVFFSS